MSDADLIDGGAAGGGDAALAGEYVLGLLTPEEARAFEGRLGVEPGLRALVARWTEDLAGLADALPEVVPPPGAEAAIMRRLFPEDRRARPGLLARLGLLPWLLGGLAAALLLLGIVNLGLLGPGEPELVAEIAAPDRSLVVLAAFDEGSGVVTLERVAGAVPAGRDQELWLIAGENPPVSLGLLPDEGDAAIAVPEALRPGLVGGTLAISDEPPGGSPTGNPGTVLGTGAITET